MGSVLRRRRMRALIILREERNERVTKIWVFEAYFLYVACGVVLAAKK
jgi:hypothetical protein